MKTESISVSLRKSRKVTAFRQNPHIMFQQKATKAPFDSHNKKPLQRFIIALKQVLYKPFRTIFEYFTMGQIYANLPDSMR